MSKLKVIKYDGCATEYPVYMNLVSLFQNIDAVVDLLHNKFQGEELGLVCRGSSGMCIATALAQRNLNWKVIYIRKEKESDHCSSRMHVDRKSNYDIKNMHLVFVDDLISQGETIRSCMEVINDIEPNAYIKTILLMCRGNILLEDCYDDHCKEHNIKLPENLILRS